MSEDGRGLVNGTLYQGIHGGVPSVTGGLSPFCAVLTELLLTAIFVLVILMSTSRSDTTMAPISIGFTLTACICAG